MAEGISPVVLNIKSGNRLPGYSVRGDCRDACRDPVLSSQTCSQGGKSGRARSAVSAGTFFGLLEQVLKDNCVGTVRVEGQGGNLQPLAES